MRMEPLFELVDNDDDFRTGLTTEPSKGFGERGAGGAIGPYAALIFDVELLEIVS